jgi:predicted signal transduction protein with EAL and GGDEF domain
VSVADLLSLASALVADPADEIRRLRRQVDRERQSRLEAEAIAGRGLRDLYQQQQQLRLVEKIATAANLTHSVEEVMAFAVAEICQFTNWPVGHVWLTKNGEPPILTSAGIWYDRNTDRYVQFRKKTEETDLAAGIGLPGLVLQSGAPAWIFDVTKDHNFPRLRAAAQCGLKAACAFPVLVRAEVAAVLEFLTDVAVTADEELLRVMAQIGTLLGRVIERKRAEDQLVHEASHDALTGLPNRALFVDRLAQSVARAQRGGNEFAVLFIDLDGFKLINDGLGHLAGDRLLIDVASRLSKSLRREDVTARVLADRRVREDDTLARLGGDEFTVLLNDIRDPSDAARAAERIQTAFSVPFELERQQVFVTASIGIAASSSGYRSAIEMLSDADLAMYRAKAHGKARTEMFDQTLHEAAVTRLRLETDLRHAVQNDEFIVHYQPIVRLDTGCIVGFEALVRWERPGVGLIYPDGFIRIAEETGLIVPLGAWVLRQACSTMSEWQHEFPRPTPLTLSVNISPRQFEDAMLIDHVREVLDDIELAPSSLRLEITESVTIKDAERAVSVLHELQTLGVQISLDDFGTGYSSLSYLHRLPIDVLKIDRSFVTGLSIDHESRQIVATIVSLARHLGMKVVAEGTETVAHVEALRALGCDFGQGYVFAKAASAAAIRDLLRAKAPEFHMAI